MTDYVIVPSNPTDEMLTAMKEARNIWFVTGARLPTDKFPFKAQYQICLSAAPPHNKVAVDKGELEALVKAAQDLYLNLNIEAQSNLKSALAPFKEIPNDND